MTTRTTILSLPREEYVHPGNRACTGCGLGIVYRIGLKALGPDTIVVVPPSCLTVLQGLFPVASTKLPSLNVTFASTAAAATGVLEALKAQGREHTKVVAGRVTAARPTSAFSRCRALPSAVTTSSSCVTTTRAT